MNNLFKYLKILGLCACLPVFNLSAQINWNYRSHAFTNKILTIKSDSGIIWIQPFTDNIIKVTILKSGISEPDTSNSVIAMPASVNVFVTDKSNVLALSTDSCSIRINKSPLTIDFFRGSEKLTTNNGFKLQNMHRQIDFTLKPEENIYGTGSRSIPLDRRGHLLNLYNNAVYGYERNVENLNYCIPLVISSQKYMILFDNPEKGTIDIGKSNANAMIFDAI